MNYMANWATCPRCGAKMKVGLRFCGRCGCPADPATPGCEPAADRETEIREVETIIDQMERLTNFLSAICAIGFFICPVLLIGLVKTSDQQLYKKMIADPKLEAAYVQAAKKLSRAHAVLAGLLALWIEAIIIILCKVVF